MTRFRLIAGRPVEDEHSPSPAEPPRDGAVLFQRVLLAAIVAVLLALAAALIYRGLP